MSDWSIAVVALSTFLVVWYAAGHVYNRRRGRRLFRWVEDGLTALGREWEGGWIGSPAAGARINLRRANPPFRRLEVTLLLENRELPFLWLLDRLRGRRDRILLRGTLRSPHRGEVVLSSNGSMDQVSGDWTWSDLSSSQRVASRGPLGERMATSLAPWFLAYGSHLRRFHWRKQDPHVVLQLSIAGLLETDAETVFADLSNALHE